MEDPLWSSQCRSQPSHKARAARKRSRTLDCYPHSPASSYSSCVSHPKHIPVHPPPSEDFPCFLFGSPACLATSYLVFSGARSARTSPLASHAAHTTHPRSWWAGWDTRLRTPCRKRQAVTGGYERTENHIQNTLSPSLD